MSVSSLVLWDGAYGRVSLGPMTWVMNAVTRAMEVAGSLHAGVFNVGIATGDLGGRLAA